MTGAETSGQADVTGRGRLGARFGLLWTAAAASGAGDGVALSAAPLLASTLTGDPRLIAGVTMALTLPYAVFGLPAGVLVDRLPRVRSMAVIDFVRTGVLAVFTLLLAAKLVSIGALYVCFFLVGTGETYFRNASQTLVPSLVPRRQLERANGRLLATETATLQFIGPLLGSALFVLAAVSPFALDTMSFLVSALLLTRLRRLIATPAPDAAQRPPAPGVLADMTTGARWLVRHPLLRDLALTSATLNLVVGAVMAVLVVYTKQVLGLGAVGYGVVLACQAVGAVIAAPLVPVLVRRFGRDHGLVVMAVIFLAANATLWAVRTPVAAGFALLLLASGSVTWDVIVMTLRQTLIPGELLGRVNSVYRLVSWGALPVGAGIAGVIAHAFGAAAVYGCCALLMVPVTARLVVGDRRRWVATALANERND